MQPLSEGELARLHREVLDRRRQAVLLGADTGVLEMMLRGLEELKSRRGFGRRPEMEIWWPGVGRVNVE